MFAEDLTQFFNADEFADNATLDGVATCGIFEKNYVTTDQGSGMTVVRLAFILPAVDATDDPVGASLVVGGVTYRVAAVDPDGSDAAIAVLLLEYTA